MSVKEMAKGITYDDPIKTRYVFVAEDWQRYPEAQLYQQPVLTSLVRCLPIVGHPHVMS